MAKNKMKKQQKVPMKKKRKNGQKIGNPNKWRAPFPMEKVYIEHFEGRVLVHLNSALNGFITIDFASKTNVKYTTVGDDDIFYQQIIEGENAEERIRNHIRKTAWVTKQQKKDFYTAIDDYFDKHYEQHLKWRKKKGLSLKIS